MQGTKECSAPGCERPDAASLQALPFCTEHFLSFCYEKLEECSRRMADPDFSGAYRESVRQFLSECARHATDLAQNGPQLDNLQRAQLLDVLLWVGELSGKLRRSTREVVSFPVRLSSGWPGRGWEEETQTRIVSQHGCMVECHHAVSAGETLQITRRDTGQGTQARVVWHRRKGAEGFEVGLEFVGAMNLWDLP